MLGTQLLLGVIFCLGTVRMLKWLCVLNIITLPLLLESSQVSYDYEEDITTEGYSRHENRPDEYEMFVGRKGGNIFSESQSFLPHIPYDLGQHGHLANYHNPHSLLIPRNKKKKKHIRKKSKYLVPLLLATIAKVGHFLPIVKLILLALFALVLFSKKAFFVSIGSLLLVMYDHFYRNKHGMSIVKDRGSAHPSQDVAQPPLSEHHHQHIIEGIEGGSWGRGESQIPKINPRGEEEQRRRWWAPQIKQRRLEDARERRVDEDITLRRFNKWLGIY